MTGPVADLAELLRTMHPVARPDEYVFVEVAEDRLVDLARLAAS